MTNNEIWRDVVGYEGLYEVSNEGRVRTNENKVTFTKRHGKRHWKQRVLKNKTPKGRNVRVTLWKDGKGSDFLVHRIVAEAFIPKVVDKESINHIDGNPKNNNVSNLEWCNHKENNNHAFDNGLMSSNKKVVLINGSTGEHHLFRSLSRASEFLGRNNGYLSAEIIKGKSVVEGYEIHLQVN